MRLINVKTGVLEEFHEPDVPPYAILSHTWGPDNEEISFGDLREGNVSKAGIGKLKFNGCCRQAEQDGLRYAWIDTCCIDKTNSTELGEAINSMFHWYEAADACYVFLADVSAGNEDTYPTELRAARWFQRGWTLQELLAPKNLVFYDRAWYPLGSKDELSELVADITGIPTPYLRGFAGLHEASVAQRMSWASNRKTKRKEDIAYSLFGLFNVMIPMMYGEGNRAFSRLQKEIMETISDDSILAWDLTTRTNATQTPEVKTHIVGNVLAASPADFANSRSVVASINRPLTIEASGVSSGYLHAKLPLYMTKDGKAYGLLNCYPRDNSQAVVAIPLSCKSSREAADEYMRPKGSKATLIVPAALSDVTCKSMRIHESQQFSDPSNHRRRYEFFVQLPSNDELEMIGVYPPSRWKKTDTLIFTGTCFYQDEAQHTLVRLRQTQSNSQDFVISLELEIGAFQPHCDLILVDRDASMSSIIATTRHMKHAVGEWAASNGTLNLLAKLSREPVDTQPAYVVRLSSMVPKPEITVDASVELDLLGHGLTLQRMLEEDVNLRPKLKTLTVSIEEKHSYIDAMKERLAGIQKDLLRLQEEERDLLHNLDQSTQDLESFAYESQVIHNKEKQILSFVRSARDFPSSCGIEQSLKWQRTTLEQLSGTLSTKASIKAIPDMTQKVFMQAVHCGHLAAMEYLFEDLDNIKFEDAVGYSTVSTAIGGGNIPALAWLLDKGADINLEDSDGSTPLARAVSFNCIPAIKELLSRGASINTKSSGKQGRTPLAIATFNNNYEVAKLLLENRAKTELSDDFLLTPLAHASRHEYLEIMNMLLRQGANIEAEDSIRQTPLAWAARENNLKAVKALLDFEADIETQDETHRTPLVLAAEAEECRPEVIDLLIERGANIECKDDYGLTPLARAAARDDVKISLLFLDRGANIDCKNRARRTPLAQCIHDDQCEMAEILLDRGADLEAEDKDGNRPLALAAMSGYADIAMVLLDRGAEIDPANNLGRTPLSQAIYDGSEGYEDVAKLLVERGANVNAKAENGETPLFDAIKQRNDNIVRLLLDKGASTNIRASDGTYPIHCAIAEGYLTRAADIETTVREAKQRFRDTLPKGYLSEEEYRLYERWYGPPLRETTPEDIGIEYLNEKRSEAAVRKDGSAEPALLRRGEGGSYEEVSYVRKGKRKTPDQIFEEIVEDNLASELSTEVEPAQEPAPDAEPKPEERENYINVVARNRREYDALMKLQKDFEASARAYEESERAQAQEEDEGLRDEEREMDEDEEDLDEREDGIQDQSISNRASRLHPYTREGHFSTNPATVSMPYTGFISPVNTMLSRTDIKHVQEAAEKAFGGPGLPHSPATPASKMNLPQNPIGMAVWQARMSEIDADAFISTFLPPTYASAMASLVEVRKRLGTEWMRKLFERGNGEGPRILDVGAGGAGLLAWQDIIRAEWEAMQARGEVSGRGPPGKQSVVIGAEKLRERISKFLQNTSFLPRLPDYLHSVDQQEQHIDANETPQPRKMFDVIIASHLLLPVKEGHRRKAILNQIWSLLNPEGGVLIVLEKGQPSGFEAVAEVRDRLLQEFLIPPGGEELKAEEQDLDPSFERVKEHGMIIAPCTNHKSCPMYLVPGRSKGRKDYCHFTQRFVRPPFLQRIMGATHRNHDDVQFSYVAIQRGTTAKSGPLAGDKATSRALEGYEDAETAPDMLSLPRQILPPIKRRGHVTLDVCTPSARIERWTIPKSFSKQAYHDARKAKWGDLWALGAKTRLQRNVRLGRPEAEDDGGVRAQRANAAARKKRNVVEVGINEHGVIGDPETIEARAQPQQRRKSKRGAALHDLKKQLAEKED
ncbi:hypothetical protein CGLO_01083 [Colletotrichum gloeosporioides Cg-14]|uniref:Uncharacterized protein n=1 Tax=Colletotrichum gloeosporioides (strain Cg-14) TaxID=1237896 RepID=T0KSZ7_COLGC|nr:hypothetical protein CGLO_01083 [Colletotrichum gloeosporioides Cg-14]